MDHPQKPTVPEVPITPWSWPFDVEIYDRAPALSSQEKEALTAFLLPRRHLAQMVSTVSQQGKLVRLMQPLSDVFAAIEGDEQAKIESTHLLLRMCAREGQPFWACEHPTWLRVLGMSLEDFFTIHKPGNQTGIRQYVIAAAYLLGCFRDLPALGGIEMVKLAYKVFGRERLEANLAPVVGVNEQWGYSQGGRVAALRSLVAEVLLLNGNPNIREITLPFLQHLYEAMEAVVPGQAMVYRLSRILVSLEILERPLALRGGLPAEKYKMERERGIAPAWVEWVERWFTTTTRPLPHRRDMRLDLLRMGRWLAQHHPEVLTPANFTRELAAEVVAAVNEMTIGDFSCENLNVPLKHPGQPWSAGRKHGFLGVLRRCFSEMIDWGWMERRFNPQRVFATPRHLKQQFRVAPRPISDDLWAKLLWAGLNLRAEDCPVQGNHHRPHGEENTEQQGNMQDAGSFYPLEMLRALAVVWLFAGLRSDELSRLRVGCARQQTVVTGEPLEESKPLCLLDIPVHKTGRAFTKPVDPLVGEVIADHGSDQSSPLGDTFSQTSTRFVAAF
jgi:hypothetical protein